MSRISVEKWQELIAEARPLSESETGPGQKPQRLWDIKGQKLSSGDYSGGQACLTAMPPGEYRAGVESAGLRWWEILVMGAGYSQNKRAPQIQRSLWKRFCYWWTSRIKNFRNFKSNSITPVPSTSSNFKYAVSKVISNKQKTQRNTLLLIFCFDSVIFSVNLMLDPGRERRYLFKYRSALRSASSDHTYRTEGIREILNLCPYCFKSTCQ